MSCNCTDLYGNALSLQRRTRVPRVPVAEGFLVVTVLDGGLPLIRWGGLPSHYLGIETASQSSLAKADELGWTVVSMKEDWSTVYGKLTDQ